MFKKVYQFNFMAIAIFLLFSFPLSTYASTSLNDYPQIKSIWDQGELTTAINKLEEVAKNAADKNDVTELIKKMTFQKRKLDQWIMKATLLEEQQRFEEAKEILDFAKAINPNYTPYVNLVDKIKVRENELDYPSEVIFDGNSFGENWKPYQNNGKLSDYGKFDNATLLIDVPEKNGWGQIGIESLKPILNFQETNQSITYNLKFEFDSSRTTGYAIEIGSQVRLAYVQRDDNQTAFIELQKAGAYSGPRVTYGKLELGTEAPDFLEIMISADNIIQIKLTDERSIQTAYLKYMSSGNHTIKVYSQAEKKDLPVKLALKSITLQQIPFRLFDVSNLKNNEKSIVLFDGKINGLWIPYSEQYEDYFSKYAHFNKKGFIVDAPRESKWGEAGILSLEPAIWLDGLGKDGEIQTTFGFDPSNTTGFSIVAGDLNHHWKSPSGKNANLTWTKVDGINISKLRLKIDDKLVLDENLTGTSPSSVVLTFKNEELSIEGDTFSKKTFKWSHIVTNRALHLFVFSHAYEKNLPVKMALKKIVLDRKMGQLVLSPKLADGVEPLPTKEIFGSAQKENWECYDGKDKDSEMYCLLNDSGCLIDIPKGIKSSDGLKSKSNIIILDKRRIDEANLKIVMQFNPETTDNFDINLGNQHLFLEKVNQQMYAFRLGKYLSRSIEGEWLKKEWSGRVNIILSKDSIEAELDGSVGVQIPERPSLAFPLQLSTAPRNDYSNDGAKFELQKITTQWIAPEGMTATDRWNFVNDEDFDPDKFLQELREGK